MPNIEWLKHHVEQYRANKTDACEAIDDFDELDKLGQGFTSADPLEQVDIRDGSVPGRRLLIKTWKPITKLS